MKTYKEGVQVDTQRYIMWSIMQADHEEGTLRNDAQIVLLFVVMKIIKLCFLYPCFVVSSSCFVSSLGFDFVWIWLVICALGRRPILSSCGFVSTEVYFVHSPALNVLCLVLDYNFANKLLCMSMIMSWSPAPLYGTLNMQLYVPQSILGVTHLNNYCGNVKGFALLMKQNKTKNNWKALHEELPTLYYELNVRLGPYTQGFGQE